jgi:hypothetical protein
VRIRAPALASSAASRPRIPLSWSSVGAGADSYTVQAQSGSGAWKTLLASTARRSLVFAGTAGKTYEFRVRGTSSSGLAGAFATATTIVPSGVHLKGARYTGDWHLGKVRGAWEGQAIRSSEPGSKLTLRYVGGAVQIIGERGPRAGSMRVTFDGNSRNVRLHSSRTHNRQVIYSQPANGGTHRLTAQVLSGVVSIEGLAINSRRG